MRTIFHKSHIGLVLYRFLAPFMLPESIKHSDIAENIIPNKTHLIENIMYIGCEVIL